MKEWDGVSKLEVGMICEAWYSAQKGWRESEVLKTDFDEYGVPIIAVRDVETDYLFWAEDFRPLKSQEQIEREESIKKMYDDLDGYHITPRLVEQNMKEWDGSGVPPVGTICELKVSNFWYKAEIRFCSDFNVIWKDVEQNIGYDFSHQRDKVSFRPLKSQEQIEREEALEEMRKDIMDYTGYAESLNELLISKGWRKIK